MWNGDNFRLGDLIGSSIILSLRLMDNLVLSDCGC